MRRKINMQITDYYKLILQGFDALDRELQEAREYTINQHNNIIMQQQAAQEAQRKQAEEQAKADAVRKSKEEK